ncbi:thiamine pyrophosphate-binding protein [Helicobacter canis]|uniref:Uncharacterized protein n=1 Tax=Helicobacter canis NCTC 12740 TaxID=1357399 RepID=V8CJK5_9HELI|nr:thiamine pyrophosphate-binding protein [Helicobacter canis]ETD27578.1 hypothetical protein HMPREF2087_00496 [Helicobacter canis NCTC 12740]
MAKVKLSDYLAKRLKEHYGVGHFFMVSGGGAMHLNDSLGRAIPYTANHHEQACSFAAEGYARVNQELAVVNVTTGPGGLNCLNGVFGQWSDSVPVLYISGQVKYTTTLASVPEIPLRQLGDQEVDIVSVVQPLTKYAVMITNPLEIKYHLDKAIYLATNGRKGPVWLDIPLDIQATMIDEENLVEFDISECSEHKDLDNLDSGVMGRVISALQKSKAPLIIAGHGVRIAHQVENLKLLLKDLNIPVVTTFNGMDSIESTHNNYIGRIGSLGQRAGNFALQNADLILCLGTRNNIRQVSYNYENYAKNAYKIVVDIDKAELQKPTLTPDIAICADLSEFIPKLLQIAPHITRPAWLEFCQNLKAKYSIIEQEQGENIEPYHFVDTFTRCLKPETILVMANGSACVCTFARSIIKPYQRHILNSGNASMGFALPAAIGSFYASNGREVVCLEGDGSIMMNLQELQTLKSANIPIKLFILHNSGYSSIRQTQKNFFNGNLTGSGASSGVEVPDFVELGRAFGFETRRLSDPQTLEKDLTQILESEGAMLVEIMLEQDYDFAPKLSARVLEDGSMVSASLEDLSPFLSKAEMAENIFKGEI